jgi:hypothetical protein
MAPLTANALLGADWIAREVLAGEIDLRAGLEEPAIKAEPANTHRESVREQGRKIIK